MSVHFWAIIEPANARSLFLSRCPLAARSQNQRQPGNAPSCSLSIFPRLSSCSPIISFPTALTILAFERIGFAAGEEHQIHLHYRSNWQHIVGPHEHAAEAEIHGFSIKRPLSDAIVTLHFTFTRCSWRRSRSIGARDIWMSLINCARLTGLKRKKARPGLKGLSH